MRKTTLVFSILAFSLSGHATEGGGNGYPLGAETFMTGYLPKVGNYLVSYNQYYSASSFKNKAPVFRDFKLETLSTTVRLIHVSDKTLFGGNWASHVFLTYADVNIKNLGGSSQHKGGLSDVIIDPFILGWHFGNFHLITAVDFYLPVGHYNRNDLANAGRNYYTVEPVVDFTYLTEGGFEVSAKTMYDHNFKNNDTHYRSGDELHSDFVIGQHFGPWVLGGGGYLYKQVSGDSGRGAVFGDFEGRAIGLGPQVSYKARNGLSVSGRYDHEFDVTNRPEGNRAWLSAALSF